MFRSLRTFYQKLAGGFNYLFPLVPNQGCPFCGRPMPMQVPQVHMCDEMKKWQRGD